MRVAPVHMDNRGDDEDQLNTLLDQQIFDPLADDTDTTPQWLSSFKGLARDDYPMAETLYAGTVFALLLFFSQQAVRIYKHCYFAPDRMCPWSVMPTVDF